MPFSRLSTAKIARIAGVHPNTVRLYEKLGWIAPVPRSPSNYRLYSIDHLYQMRLARLALGRAWPGRNIRRSALSIIRQAASYDYGGALELAYRHLATVQSERAQADAAAHLLERWAQGIALDPKYKPLQIREAAALLNLSTESLRNWERQGLINIPRNPQNGYRLYCQPEISRLRIIRMLRLAGYSLMAILRMLSQLDRQGREDLQQVLDTPRPDEDIYSAADQWITTLTDQENCAREIIKFLEEMIRELKPTA